MICRCLVIRRNKVGFITWNKRTMFFLYFACECFEFLKLVIVFVCKILKWYVELLIIFIHIKGTLYSLNNECVMFWSLSVTIPKANILTFREDHSNFKKTLTPNTVNKTVCHQRQIHLEWKEQKKKWFEAFKARYFCISVFK